MVTEQTKPTTKQEIAQQTRNQAEKTKPAKRRWSLAKVFGLLVIIIVLTAGVLAAQFYWQHDRNNVQAQLAELSVAIRALKANDNRSDKHLEAQNQSLAELKKHVAVLGRVIKAQGKELQEFSSTTTEDLMLAEALHLTRLASRRLPIEHSNKIPLALLENVDAILQRMENADIAEIRDLLARDMNAVRLAVDVDVEGIFVELVALAENIDQLPIIKLVSSPQQVIDDSEAKEGSTTALLDYLSQSLSQLVRIRQHDQPIVPLMLPDDQSIVRHNIAVLFQQAQTAALRGQQNIYSYCLEQINSNLAQYFQPVDQMQVVQRRLDKLEQTQIVRSLPQIQGSVAALEALVQQRRNSQPKTNIKEAQL